MNHPVRCNVLKLRIGGLLLVQWMITCKFPLLYVLAFVLPLMVRV